MIAVAARHEGTDAARARPEDTSGAAPSAAAPSAAAPAVPPPRSRHAPSRHRLRHHARRPGRWEVPHGLDVAAGLAWRLLLIAAAASVVIYLAGTFSVVLIPVILALIAASLLAPEAHVMSTKVGWMPHAVATAIVVVGGLAIVGGVFTGVVFAFISGLPELTSQLTGSLSEIQNWVRTGPLGLNNQQFTAIGDQILTGVQTEPGHHRDQRPRRGRHRGRAVHRGPARAVHADLLHPRRRGDLAVPAAGRPATGAPRADLAGRRAFASLVGYTRAIVVVAFIDAVTAGLGLWAIGVPLAVPLAALIFFGAFVPTVGAVVSGAVAALVALVSGGVPDMLLVVLLLLAVQNLEGYILQPLFLGKSIKLHPLAVVLPIACGLVVAGIPGALLAVPLVTVARRRRALAGPARRRHGRPRVGQPAGPPLGAAGVRGPEGPGGPGGRHRVVGRQSPRDSGPGGVLRVRCEKVCT